MGAVELWGTSGDGTRYLYDDSKVHIWREMTANLEPDIYPSRKYDFDTLMFCFGAEPVPAQGGTPSGNRRGFGAALASAAPWRLPTATAARNKRRGWGTAAA